MPARPAGGGVAVAEAAWPYGSAIDCFARIAFSPQFRWFPRACAGQRTHRRPIRPPRTHPAIGISTESTLTASPDQARAGRSSRADALDRSKMGPADMPMRPTISSPHQARRIPRFSGPGRFAAPAALGPTPLGLSSSRDSPTLGPDNPPGAARPPSAVEAMIPTEDGWATRIIRAMSA